MRFFADYDRSAAVLYAHQWAYGRNPAFYDYENVGGDCTNFASQCVFAGSGVMNFTPDFGWYYIDANQKSPSWTARTSTPFCSISVAAVCRSLWELYSAGSMPA